MFIRKNKINKQKITGSVRSSKYGLTPFLYEVVVGFLAFCFILQPNLLVLASVRNSDKEKTLQTSKSDGNERAEKSQVEEPLIKKTAAEKSSKVFKAGDGLSKIDAVNLKNRINEQIAVENSKRPENNNSAQTEITVKENEIGTYPESEKNESNIK
nr:hypothetical protein [Pyrinomonadaceae bacterium]